MSSEQERIERLERTVRRQVFALAGLGIAFAGAVAWSAGGHQDTIRASAFEAVNSAGQVVAQLRAGQDGGILYLYTEPGPPAPPAVSLGAGSDTKPPSLALWQGGAFGQLTTDELKLGDITKTLRPAVKLVRLPSMMPFLGLAGLDGTYVSISPLFQNGISHGDFDEFERLLQAEADAGPQER